MGKRKTIHKNALVAQIANKSGLETKVVDLVLVSLQESILDNLNNGLGTKINGFLGFEEIKVAPRKGVDPDTGRKIELPAKRRMNAKVSEKFQEKIKQE